MWRDDAEREGRAFGITNIPRLLEHREARVPFAAGWWRPSIVLPTEATSWSAEQRCTVLRHELAHVAHRDIAWQVIATFATALHWMNPLVWLARRQLTLAHERAADDAVIAGGWDRVNYAALLAAAARGSDRLASGFAVAPMARSSTLRQRVARLVDGAQRRGPIGAIAKLAAASTTLAVALGVSLTGLRGQTVAPHEAKPAAASQPVSNWSRNYRDTLLLEKSFAEHYTGTADEALAAFRKELAAGGVVIPPAVTIELRPDKRALVIDYPERLISEKSWGLTDYLTQQGWWSKRNEAVFQAKIAAIERTFEPLQNEVEKQRKRVDVAYAEMVRLREANDIIDPDPESFGSTVSAPDRYILDLEKPMIDQRLRVAKRENQLAQLAKIQPEALDAALRIVGIEDQNSIQTLADLKAVRTKEAELLAKGAGDGDARLVAARAQGESLVQMLSETLKNVRENQASLLEIERRALKESEGRCQEAKTASISDKKKMSAYIEAKARYLQAKRILDAAQVKLSTELLDRGTDR